MSQTFSTPESAFAEHEKAYMARDIKRFLASIDFEQEAREALTAKGNGNKVTDIAQISELAVSRKAALNLHLEQYQFKAETFDDCEILKKWQDSDTQVRFTLNCKDARGSTFFPIRLMLLANGWRVVRGT